MCYEFDMNWKDKLILAIKFLMMSFYYQIDRFVIKVAKEYDRKGKKLLDVGSGIGPYRKYFKKLKYLSQDVEQNQEGSIDYVADLNQGLGKIKTASFDYVLCTQVLEHLKEPSKVFKEFERILKPGGRLFLTTNFIYQIHMEPNDYFRFTKHGLEYLGKSNGFRVEHLKAQGGIFSVLAYVLVTLPIRLGLEKVGWGYYAYLVIFSPLIMAVNLMAYGLDWLDREKRLVINYEVIYSKLRKKDGGK